MPCSSCFALWAARATPSFRRSDVGVGYHQPSQVSLQHAVRLGGNTVHSILILVIPKARRCVVDVAGAVIGQATIHHVTSACIRHHELHHCRSGVDAAALQSQPSGPDDSWIRGDLSECICSVCVRAYRRCLRSCAAPVGTPINFLRLLDSPGVVLCCGTGYGTLESTEKCRCYAGGSRLCDNFGISG